MTAIDDLLEQRGNTHGNFSDVSHITETIMGEMRNSPNWPRMPDPHRVAVFMIAMKLGRIASGDYNEVDHWRDIAGYAKLVENEIVAESSGK
jgi:hypothetical protein